jgi:hypothetical protein
VGMGAEITDSVNAWYTNTFITRLMQYPGLKAVYRYKFQDSTRPDYFTSFIFPSKAAIDSLGTSTDFTQAVTEMNSHWPNGEFSIYISGNYEKIKSWVKENYHGDLQAVTMEAFDLLITSEVAVNTWYNDTHVPLIMKYPGVKKAVRYWRSTPASTDVNRCALPKYITIYYYGTKDELANQETSSEWAAVLEDMNKETLDDQMNIAGVLKLDLIKSFTK